MTINTSLRLFFVLLLSICSTILSANQCDKLNIIWHNSAAAIKLVELGNEYQKSTGIKIDVIFVSYGNDWLNTITSELATHGSDLDIAIWDSQALASYASEGHIVLLNPLLESSSLLSLSDFDANALKRYGEYPEGSGQIWSLPINQDAMGFMYRKDLFEDPKEQQQFKQHYGYELTIPKTYSQLRDIAEFFTRPEQGLYGWAQFGSQEYDLVSAAANGFIWSYGGELWNYKTNEIQGYLNSAASIEGFQTFIDLFAFSPPESRVWAYEEIDEAFQDGKLAMTAQWYVFFHTNNNPVVSDYADKVAFANLPGAIGQDGLYRQQFSMGGQGMGINKYSNCKKESWAFIEWFQQHKQQMQYSIAGQSGRLDVLNDESWQQLTSWNSSFLAATSLTNDYWHLPEYTMLLEILQQEMASAVIGAKTAQQALTDAAIAQEQLLSDAGYKISRTDHIPDVPDTIVTPVGEKIHLN
jgi:multiple sugar transport system substrate-binding protein